MSEAYKGIAAPRAYFRDDSSAAITADEVIDSGGADYVDTGLLDSRGERIYRRRPTVQFGFVSGKA